MKNKNKKQKGFTLLEYAAGAVVIVTVVYIGLQAMGTGLQTFFTDVGTWASTKGSSIK